MAWLERTAPKRIDPQKVLPGAKSIICLAASYETRVDESRESAETQPTFTLDLDSDTRGFIARYARFADYHDVLGERLKPLTAFVNQLGGAGNALAVVRGHRAVAGT